MEDIKEIWKKRVPYDKKEKKNKTIKESWIRIYNPLHTPVYILQSNAYVYIYTLVCILLIWWEALDACADVQSHYKKIEE